MKEWAGNSIENGDISETVSDKAKVKPITNRKWHTAFQIQMYNKNYRP